MIKMADHTPVPKAKMILQLCTSASIQVETADSLPDAKFVEIGEGIVISICFLKGATDETVRRMARVAMNVKICGGYGNRVSVLELPGDVLILPHSTLGGRPKGRRVEYKPILDKCRSSALYQSFVRQCDEMMRANPASERKSVRYGSYNYKQKTFTLQSDGPFTHLFEF